MNEEIDRSKCGTEYSLCNKCKREAEYGSYGCMSCTQAVDCGYDFLLCGIPVGTGITYLHKNFEPKEKVGGEE